MPQYPVAKQFCLTICTVKCGLVSEWVTRPNLNFFINEILNFRTAVIFQNFHLFIKKNATNLFFSVLSATYSPFRALKRMFASSLQSKRTLFHKIPCKFLVQQNAFFCGFVHFWRTKWVTLNFAIWTNTRFLNNVFDVPAQNLVQCKTYCFKIRQSWNRRAERVLRKVKKLVQSRDRANMKSVLAQSCNINLERCHYVPALLKQHNVVLRLVWKLWKDQIKTASTTPLNQWFHQTWIFGPSHV